MSERKLLPYWIQYIMQVSRDKQRITNCFNRAATQYAEVNHVQREISQKLISILAMHANDNSNQLLDLGCGLGLDVDKLKILFPNAKIILIDRAQHMLSKAMEINVGKTDIATICADFDELPIIANTCAVLYSNMAMQWSMNIQHTLAEFYRVMQAGGVLAYSLPIMGTYQEIISCQIKMNTHRYNQFISQRKFILDAQRAGFQVLESRIFSTKIRYNTAKELFRSIRKMGAQHIKNSASSTYQKHYYHQLLMNMEYFREQEGVPLSYKIAYGILRK